MLWKIRNSVSKWKTEPGSFLLQQLDYQLLYQILQKAKSLKIRSQNQITKSGTSIGANYREANRSRSKADFSNKIRICESEASETAYWSEIISELNWADNQNIFSILKEVNELLAIFTSIGNKIGRSA